MVILLGTVLACGALTVCSLFAWCEPFAAHLLLGGALYLAAVLLTGIYHVPRNETLAKLEPPEADVEGRWKSYLAG